jgi:hypothetical protein
MTEDAWTTKRTNPVRALRTPSWPSLSRPSPTSPYLHRSPLICPTIRPAGHGLRPLRHLAKCGVLRSLLVGRSEKILHVRRWLSGTGEPSPCAVPVEGIRPLNAPTTHQGRAHRIGQTELPIGVAARDLLRFVLQLEIGPRNSRKDTKRPKILSRVSPFSCPSRSNSPSASAHP